MFDSLHLHTYALLDCALPATSPPCLSCHFPADDEDDLPAFDGSPTQNSYPLHRDGQPPECVITQFQQQSSSSSSCEADMYDDIWIDSSGELAGESSAAAKVPARGLMGSSREFGWGSASSSRSTVVTLFGDAAPVYLCVLDHQRLRLEYDSAEGLPLAYIVHKDLLRHLLGKVGW